MTFLFFYLRLYYCLLSQIFKIRLEMDKNYSIFEAAHKGDFEFVRTKLEEDPNLLHQRDSVGISTLFTID